MQEDSGIRSLGGQKDTIHLKRLRHTEINIPGRGISD